MLFIWILFGMIITLDVIVYGLYRMIKERLTKKEIISIEIDKHLYIEGQLRKLEAMAEGLEKGDVFILSELGKLEEKVDKKANKVKKKKGMKIGRPRKQDKTYKEMYREVFELSGEISYLWLKGPGRDVNENKEILKRIEVTIPVAEKILKNEPFLMAGTHLNSPRSKEDFLTSLLLKIKEYKRLIIKKGVNCGRNREQD